MPTGPTDLQFSCRHQYPTGFALDATFETDARVTALFGPSGAGKTTIVSLIAGLIRPRDGNIQLGGDTLTDTSRGIFLPPEKRGLGILFQDHRLFPHLSVRSNLTFGRTRRRGASADFTEVVESLELSDLLDRSPSTLSGGQKQRAALARAVLARPKLLILDEPLSSIEIDLRNRMTDFIEATISKFNLPTILVTHDQELVERLATRVIPVRQGRIDPQHEQPD